MKKLVLAYSGGLDTSYCAVSLSKEYEVHAVSVNTGGFTTDEIKDIESKAYQMGVTNYAIATAAILASSDKYYNTDYRIAVVTFVSIIYLGCAINHIREAVINRNFHMQNIGPSFINDVITPIVLLLTLD